MSHTDTITRIAQKLPLESFLKGSYAYSYTSYWRAVPPYKKEMPQLGAYYESKANPGVFQQVPGYALVSYAAYIHFNGDGTFYEKGKSSRGGGDIADVNNTGTYTVDFDAGAYVFTGIFTVSNNQDEFINHYFIMADEWKELHFMMLDTYLRMPVATGVLRRIQH